MKEADIRKEIAAIRERLARLEKALPAEADDVPEELKELLRNPPTSAVTYRYGAIFPARKR